MDTPFAVGQSGLALYLIPTTLGPGDPAGVIPVAVLEIVRTLRYFIVEEVKTAAQFLRRANHPLPLTELTFFELNEHTPPTGAAAFIAPLRNGFSMGLLSEAGCPVVADPGALVVQAAHSQGIRVVPLTGPSSVLMAVMASGFSGQRFAFNGYLPVHRSERISRIRQLERRSAEEDQAQFFIETPYRNMSLMADLLECCMPDTMLSVAADLTMPSEYIACQPVALWRNSKIDLQKRPCVFGIKRLSGPQRTDKPGNRRKK